MKRLMRGLRGRLRPAAPAHTGTGMEDEWSGRLDLSPTQRKRLRRSMRGVCMRCNCPPMAGATLCERHAAEARARNGAAYRVKAEEHLRLYGMSAHRLRRLGTFRPEAQARIVSRLPADVQARLLVG